MNHDEGEKQDVESTRIPSPQGNIFARFAFTAPHERSRTSSKVVSSLSSRMSPKRKRDADADTDEKEERNLRTKVIDKDLELPSTFSRPSSSKIKLYDHLRPLHDNLNIGLDIIFCGINPGQRSAEIGHHYGNPNNHFWSCLHESGLTTRKLDPGEDAILPRDFSIGLTNLVARPTAQQTELSKDEQVAGVSVLLEKIARYKPRVLCFVGLGIADVVRSNTVAVAQGRDGAGAKLKSKSKRSSLPKTVVGLQPYKMIHRSDSQGPSETLFFAVSSTSGRVVRYKKADKVKQFRDLHQLVRDMKEGILDTSTISHITALSIQDPESFG